MATKLLQTKKTTIAYGINDSATAMRLTNLLKLDGSSVSASDIGDVLYGTFDPGTSREEIFSIDGANVTVNSDGTLDITGVVRGLKEVSPYNTGGFATDHPAGAVVIFGNNPQLFQTFASIPNDNVFEGVNEFEQVPTTSGGNPIAPEDLTRKAYVDALVLGVLTTINVIVPGLAGITVADGDLVYLDTATGTWLLCDADTPATVNNVLLGIAQGSATVILSNVPIPNGVLLQGIDDAQSGLVAGEIQYASNTAGGISPTPGTTEVTVGVAKTATELYFDPRFDQQLTEDQQDALAGDSGTPSSTNKFVTQKGLQIQAEQYAASAAGNDTYAVTLSPVPAAYVNGMVVRFKADVANTGPATLNVNTLGAISIVTSVGTALVTGDIVANQIVQVIYNSTGPVFELQNPASMVLTNPASAILAAVPNTYETDNTWYSWTQPFLSYTASGPTETMIGLTNTFTVGTNAKGGFGVKELSASSSVSLSERLPGNGSNEYYTAVSSKDVKFKWRMKQGVNGSGDYLGFGIVDATATLDDVETSVATGIRFVNNNGVIFASNGNGASNTNTNVDSGITDANYNTYEIVFNPGVDAKFYINGTLVATHTTNLPTGSLQFFGIGYTKGTNNLTFYVNPVTFSLEQ